jgi:2Fe-2S ferredoxin
MVKITFRDQGGRSTSIDARVGESLMSQAKAWSVAGIDADCGGSMVCGTCQVFIDEPWLQALPPASAGEAALIEFSLYPRDASRLSCQIVVTDAMAGMTLEVPSAQK